MDPLGKGKIVTFYSYKGGTGRTMALANTEWILASNGAKVLTIDWDLEAPGLHRYFRPFLADKELIRTESQGVIDFMTDFTERLVSPSDLELERGLNWFEQYADVSSWAKPLLWPSGLDAVTAGGSIDFLPAGRQSPQYASLVNSFDWAGFYSKLGGGAFMDAMRKQMVRRHDWVLIDSRTGVSDTSGICTIQLPDILVICFTLNYQSIDGASAVATAAKQKRPDVRVLPLPTRLDGHEDKLMRAMMAYSRRAFGPLLDRHIDQDRYWFEMGVPYFSRYAYMEKLAPFEENVSNATSTLPSMELLTRYITDSMVTGLRRLPQAERVAALHEFERFPDDVEAPRSPDPAREPRSWLDQLAPVLGRVRYNLKRWTIQVMVVLAVLLAWRYIEQKWEAQQAQMLAQQSQLETQRSQLRAQDLLLETQRSQLLAQQYKDELITRSAGQAENTAWSKAPPSQAWCYQQYRRKKDRLPFSIHCHWSQQRCEKARSSSAAVTGCKYVLDIPRSLWNPNPAGWMDSWFQYSKDTFPIPFPQLDASVLADQND